MSEADLRAEIEALRREIAALRAEAGAAGVAAADNAEGAAEAAESHWAGLVEQLQGLAGEIADFAEDTEKGIADHPLTSVLGALVLGILIGRMIY